MKKEQLARQLAKESKITAAAAADQVDRILNDILERIRRGRSASLPGLGTFAPGQKKDFQFDRGIPFRPGRQQSRRDVK
jgi:nucleoid DNA-binding protein